MQTMLLGVCLTLWRKGPYPEFLEYFLYSHSSSPQGDLVMIKNSQIYFLKSCIYDIFLQIICYGEKRLNNFNGEQRLYNFFFQTELHFQ